MAFIRLCDSYIDHPKFLALSAYAFRLWHEGMAFCRKHQTDGLIPMAALQGFRYHKAAYARELASPYQPEAFPLWEIVEGYGYRVHDYLFWNLSKDEEQAGREAATARMRKLRKTRRDTVGDGEHLSNVREMFGRSDVVGDAVVLDRIGSDQDLKKKKEKEKKAELPVHARSGRPIFDGQRLVVFEWQLDDLTKMLGIHTEAFDLHEWFFIADQKAKEGGIVKKARDWWPWLQAETLAEAQRRGLPVEAAPVHPEDAMWDAIGRAGPSVRP